MATAFQAATYFLQLAADEAEPVFLTHLHLQKLLYYAQGWSLGLCGEELFDDPIQAWTHGPVVRSVFPRFRDFGDKPIVDFKSDAAGYLSANEKFRIAAVWEQYKGVSAIQLRNQTHREPPWREARQGLRPTDPGEVVMSTDSMRSFFAGEAANGKPAPIAIKANWGDPKMNPALLETAQAVFIRNAELLRRLAQ